MRLAAIVLMAFVVGSCQASYPSQPSSPRTPIALLVLYRFGGAGPLLAGATSPNTALDAYTIDADGVAENVTQRAIWQSSNETVARISPAIPNFIPLAPGIAEVTASYQGLLGRLEVVVSEAPSVYPRLNIRGGLVSTGQSVSMFLSFLPSSGGSGQEVGAQATWSSADQRIATVAITNSLVRLTGVGPGTTQITATYNGLSASFTQSVRP